MCSSPAHAQAAGLSAVAPNHLGRSEQGLPTRKSYIMSCYRYSNGLHAFFTVTPLVDDSCKLFHYRTLRMTRVHSST